MSFNSAPPSFLPPAAPPRKSRSGGIILLLAGLLAAASPFIAWVPNLGEGKANLKQIADAFAKIEGTPFLNDPRNWLYAILGGAAVAIIFGLIGLAGNKGVNITVGFFALLAAVAIAYPPVWAITNDTDFTGTLANLGAGYYAAAAAGFLALLGMLFAFIGAAKK